MTKIKEGYKNTEIGMIPLGWCIKQLSKIAHINMGQSPDSSAYNQKGDGLYLIQGNADIKNRKSKPKIWTNKITKICNIGEILMTVRAPVGAITLLDHRVCIGRGVCAIKAEKAEKMFLYHYLVGYESKWKNIEQGSTFTAIGSNDVKELLIRLPPLAEQQKIAEILTIVDEMIETTRKVIDQTKKVKQSLLQDLLTKGIGHTKFKKTKIGKIPEDWEVTRIADLVEKIKKSVEVEKKKLYRQIGIRSHAKGIFYKKPIIGEKLGNKRVFWIEPDCLILNIVFAWEKAVSLTTNNEIGMIASHRFPMYRANSLIFLDYLVLFLQSKKGQEALTLASPGGAGRNKTLNQKFFLEIMIPVPPKEEQKKIATLNSRLCASIQEEENNLKSLLQLKKGLMQDLLTGKVRV